MVIHTPTPAAPHTYQTRARGRGRLSTTPTARSPGKTSEDRSPPVLYAEGDENLLQGMIRLSDPEAASALEQLPDEISKSGHRSVDRGPHGKDSASGGSENVDRINNKGFGGAKPKISDVSLGQNPPNLAKSRVKNAVYSTGLGHKQNVNVLQNKNSTGDPIYRKVAVVENFFDIIYNVHVDLEGRPGKHAGQKRTYRTITETYAFLPREAVTRFLLGCTECQKRPRSPSPPVAAVAPPLPTPSPSPTPPTGVAAPLAGPQVPHGGVAAPAAPPKLWSPVESLETGGEPPEKKMLLGGDIDFSLPITTTYLKYMRSLGCRDEDAFKFENRHVSLAIERFLCEAISHYFH
ncbi:unnamed protein product [Phaedon cochleariae]|uniref:Nucleolar protein 4 n=1 Tax=Phaedon cochleariae TaxID=80249 RepID=A0A9N9S961_PHACE|nr:unnamed protein product [Phaedon cochleariae]